MTKYENAAKNEGPKQFNWKHKVFDLPSVLHFVEKNEMWQKKFPPDFLSNIKNKLVILVIRSVILFRVQKKSFFVDPYIMLQDTEKTKFLFYFSHTHIHKGISDGLEMLT